MSFKKELKESIVEELERDEDLRQKFLGIKKMKEGGKKLKEEIAEKLGKPTLRKLSIKVEDLEDAIEAYRAEKEDFKEKINNLEKKVEVRKDEEKEEIKKAQEKIGDLEEKVEVIEHSVDELSHETFGEEEEVEETVERLISEKPLQLSEPFHQLKDEVDAVEDALRYLMGENFDKALKEQKE